MKKKDTPMKLLTRILVSLAVAGGAFAATPLTRTIPVSDTNWFFSPYNWYVNDSAFGRDPEHRGVLHATVHWHPSDLGVGRLTAERCLAVRLAEHSVADR